VLDLELPRPAGAEFVNLVDHPEVLTGPGGATLAPPTAGNAGPRSTQTVQRPIPTGGLVYRPDGRTDAWPAAERFEGPRTVAPPASQSPPPSQSPVSSDPWPGPSPATTDARPRPTAPPLVPSPNSREAARPAETTVADGSVGTPPLGRGAAGYSLFESDEALVAAVRRVLPGRGAIVRGQSPTRSDGTSTSPAGNAPFAPRLGRPGWR